MKISVVFDHPRRHSFCGAVLDEFVAGLGEAGHEFESADLHSEGFDPCMTEAGEPDWDDPEAELRDMRKLGRNLTLGPA